MNLKAHFATISVLVLLAAFVKLVILYPPTAALLPIGLIYYFTYLMMGFMLS